MGRDLTIGRELRIEQTATREQTSPLKRPLLFYSKRVKFLGSVAELGGFLLLTNQPPLDSDKIMAIRNKLKKVLLLVE